MTYTSYDGKTARLCVASSRDLLTWTKTGPAFAKAGGGRFRDRWSKSGAIVCEQRADRFVATRIDNRYWMYWGDTDIFLAWSDNLVDWTPLERTSAPGQPAVLASAITPRRHRFDSALVEPGPPAIVTPRGILLLYNSANRQAAGDPVTAGDGVLRRPGSFRCERSRPRSSPARPRRFSSVRTQHETVGQVGNVCFVEGLVRFNGTMAAVLRHGRFTNRRRLGRRSGVSAPLKLSPDCRVCSRSGCRASAQ